MNLLIIDVFDSFTYNLMHICEKYVKNVEVIRVNNICATVRWAIIRRRLVCYVPFGFD